MLKWFQIHIFYLDGIYLFIFNFYLLAPYTVLNPGVCIWLFERVRVQVGSPSKSGLRIFGVTPCKLSGLYIIWIKAILRDVMGEEKFFFSLFFIIDSCNDPCCHRILSPQCIRAEYFA